MRRDCLLSGKLKSQRERRLLAIDSVSRNSIKSEEQRIGAYDRQIRALAEACEPARRMMQVKAIGPQTATALVAAVGDPHVFKNGRGVATWLGVTPRQHSTGGKERLGQNTRRGDGDPPLGRLGLTETEARRAGYKMLLARMPMTDVARAILVRAVQFPLHNTGLLDCELTTEGTA